MGIRVIYRLNQGDNKKCRSSEEQQSEWAGSPHDQRNPLNEPHWIHFFTHHPIPLSTCRLIVRAY